jgi:hypothetical protein
MEQGNGAAAPEMSQAEAEALHEMLVAIETRLQSIGERYPAAFAPALFSLATYTVEKVYACSPEIDNASMLLSRAQEQGLDNWVAQAEREREAASEPKIIT